MNLIDASPKIYYGDNALDSLDDILPQGTTLLVCDPFMVQSGISKSITGRLDSYGREYAVFSNVRPDPSVETVAECMQMVFRHKPESLIALGGGSAIDTTKASLYFCLQYKELLMSRHHIYKPFFVAVPTTSGTGSEVTSYTVVTDTEADVKIPLSDRCMIPDVAILDPDFTKTLPSAMVAYTGMDVLTHAIESYVSPAANTFTDMYAIQAISMVFQYLPVLYAGSKDTEVHQEMMIASTLAGLAFNNSGLGICHGLAHTIGAEFHVPHGKANSMVLPYCIAFNAGIGRYQSDGCERSRRRYAELASKLFLKGSGAEAAAELVRLIMGLNRKLDIQQSLQQSGVDRHQFDEEMPGMTQKILADMTTEANPRKVNTKDVQKLLGDVYEGVNPLG